VLFIIVAIGLLLRRRAGVLPAAASVLWLCVWTAVAVVTHGASTETIREGVREASVIALAVIVYNGRGVVNPQVSARVIQFAGCPPAVLALYQLASHTGMDIAGNLRSNGTFSRPSTAVMFFAIAACVSMWRYLDYRREPFDGFCVILFAAAAISTFTIDGLITLFAMMMTLGVMSSGARVRKLLPCVIGILVVVVFFATPLGAKRIAHESTTSIGAAERGEPSTSLAWRIEKWRLLLPEWEHSPLVGRGLGTTTTSKAIPGSRFAGYPPHNEYVRYLVEAGIFGLAILMWALVILVRSLVRRRRLPGTSCAGTLNASTLALVVIGGCLVNSLADNTLLSSPTCYAAALIIVAALCLPDRDAGGAPEAQTV
jgi:O-antigen ligase